MRRRTLEIAGAVALGLLLVGLAAWQLDGLGGPWDAPIPHGRDEDWDWQLTIYEVGRRTIAVYGELPGWSPYTAGGGPALAHPEAPYLYPLFALVLALGTTAGIKALLVAHQALLVLGGYLAGRELGLSRPAAHLGALFVLCSAFLPGFIGVGHVMFTALGWLPLAWVAQRRGRWGLAGLCLAMTLLAGGPYLFVYGGMWLAADGVLSGLREDRLRWLALALALNGLLLGVEAARWPVGLALVAAALAQRPEGLRRTLPLAALGLAVAGLVTAPRWLTALELFERAGRLAARPSLSVADPYTLPSALAVLSGLAERPSGHEGPNVFFSPIPVALGGIGLLAAAWRRPRWAALGLCVWCLGWGGATPVNLLEAVHRLPGASLLRVVERYSLVWTLFLGWGAGHLVDRAWAWWRPAAAVLAVALAGWVITAAPQAATLQRLGVGPEVSGVARPFAQVRGEHSNYHAVLENRGRPDCSSAVWGDAPPQAVQAVGEPGYRGEVWRLADGATLPADITPDRISVTLDAPATVVVNQNAFPGWTVDGAPASSHAGLIAAPLAAGRHTFAYRPPRLGASWVLMALGLTLALGSLSGSAPWTSRARPSTGTGPRPGTAPPPP
ncbi:MAG: hypothetical protein H6739_24160 [Alphaproteobacteria bacterium]|nr:hypothetical protein [Alphaproteobacteria bacterium]